MVGRAGSWVWPLVRSLEGAAGGCGTHILTRRACLVGALFIDRVYYDVCQKGSTRWVAEYPVVSVKTVSPRYIFVLFLSSLLFFMFSCATLS